MPLHRVLWYFTVPGSGEKTLCGTCGRGHRTFYDHKLRWIRDLNHKIRSLPRRARICLFTLALFKLGVTWHDQEIFRVMKLSNARK